VTPLSTEFPVRADTRPPKSEQTRARIVETALRLFKERGYDRTTMRAIAAEAGVSVGNAYYYFDSKEHLIQGFYHLVESLHAEAVVAVLPERRDFESRLRATMLAWLDVATPYHEFAAQFFKNAADPASPLSPFSAESAPAREASIDIYRRVLDGSSASVPPNLAAELPRLLWLYQMGIVLFWVHDRSAGTTRSRDLVDRTVPLVARLVAISRYRMLRSIVDQVVDLVRTLGPGQAS
jgi:AcrR family transcriptional regulator